LFLLKIEPWEFEFPLEGTDFYPKTDLLGPKTKRQGVIPTGGPQWRDLRFFFSFD